MDTPERRGAVWRTSSYTSPNGDCVEVGPSSVHVHVRDTKDRDGGMLTVGRASWIAFVAEAAGR